MEGSSHYLAWPLFKASPLSMEKGAEEDVGPPPSPDPSVENLLTSLTQEISDINRELPVGIAKTAALRPGTDEELPPVTKKNIWRHPHAHPLVLTLILLDKYNNEYLEWDAEVLRTTMFRDGISISNSVWTKIQAARVPLTSPSPWRQWETFHVVCRGLAGIQPNMSYFEKPELGHLVHGVDILKIMDRPREFLLEIDKFIAVTCKDVGTPYAPPPIDFVQDEIDQPQFKCSNCGLKERDDGDVRCPHCTSDKLERLRPENADFRDEVKKRFDQLKKLPLEEAGERIEESRIDMPAARLLMHWEYRNQQRSHLVEQLKTLARG